MMGKPISWAAFSASSIFSTAWLTGVFRLISSSFFTKRSRSSVSMIASTLVPSTWTPYSLSVPFRYSSVPQFRAVCPPKAKRMPSGRSFLMISVTKCALTGWKYTWSAIPSEVWMVAMFGLTNTLLMPSSRRAFSACEPE